MVGGQPAAAEPYPNQHTTVRHLLDKWLSNFGGGSWAEPDPCVLPMYAFLRIGLVRNNASGTNGNTV